MSVIAEYRPLDENGLLFLWQQILLQFVAKEEGKGLSTNDLTDELLQKIQNAGDYSFDGNYISLTNKPQINGIILTGNKTLEDLGITQAIQNAIGDVTQISFEPVDIFSDLPETGENGVFYLVPNTGEGVNTFDEYIWVESKGAYELFGTIQNTLDLSGYVQKTDIVPLSNDEILEIINAATQV